MLSAYLRSPLPAKTVKEAQRGILRPMAFRPHLPMDLAFYGRGFELPTGQTMPYWELGMHILIYFSIR